MRKSPLIIHGKPHQKDSGKVFFFCILEGGGTCLACLFGSVLEEHLKSVRSLLFFSIPFPLSAMSLTEGGT